jgi:hypothetical protein
MIMFATIILLFIKMMLCYRIYVTVTDVQIIIYIYTLDLPCMYVYAMMYNIYYIVIILVQN